MDILKALVELKDTPVPSLLVIGGLVLLGLSLVQVQAKELVLNLRVPWWMLLIIALILIGFGAFLFVLPMQSSGEGLAEPTTETEAEEQSDTEVEEAAPAEEEVAPEGATAEEAVPAEGECQLGYSMDCPVTANFQWTPVFQEFDGVEMALVPVGCFMMGSESGDSDEVPVHEQCFDEPFWIDAYEVTNAQYGSEGSFSGDNLPREPVDWYKATAHCESRGARLPTEAEWEYAARGPDGLVFPWGNELIADNVVYDQNSGGATADVGSRPDGASWVGAYDMSGNVWEWVSSLYQDYPYDATDGREVDGVSDARVRRGGSGNDNSSLLRAADRNWNLPDIMFSGLGFRCARSL